MAENIDGTAGGLGPYNTAIPALVDNANIQEALRIYHYGSKFPPATMGDVIATSVAGHFKTMSTRVGNLENQGVGSRYDNNEPTSVPNGYIWVDGDSAAPIFNSAVVSVPSVVKYQNTQPTTNLQDGMQWVDKDDAFLTTYVYNQGTTTWIRSNQIAKYQTTAPTGNIVEGSLWVDKGSTPLKMYVYDATDLEWKEIGA
jgi:hypothetical protein